jgi:hypothetical protein
MVILGDSGVYLEFTEYLAGLGVKYRDICGICRIYRGLNGILEGLGPICK